MFEVAASIYVAIYHGYKQPLSHLQTFRVLPWNIFHVVHDSN